jgi:SlyX protein
MTNLDELVQQLEHLEMRIAFQDDTIEQLNQVVTSQQQQIDKLHRQLELLIKRMKEVTITPVASQSEETPPPHY